MEENVNALRLAFMGTPEFAVPTLAALVDAGHDIVAVYTRPPRRKGRGQKLRKSPAHEFAEQHGLAVHTPARLKGGDDQAAFTALGLDAAVIAAYGLILPAPILEAPRLGCLNLHPSLLPRWRGAAPIQRAIEAGDRETGVTIMIAEQELDSGPTLLARRMPIAPDTTAGELGDQLASLGAAAMIEALDGVARGALAPRPQATEGVTYANKVEKHEGHIDWTRGGDGIGRLVRAFNPAPGAFFEFEGARVEVLRCELHQGRGGGEPGEVLDDRLLVACGDGAVRILEVRRAGRAAMSAEKMLRGFPIPAGARLG